MNSLIFPIEEESQVGFARRTAVALAREAGFDTRLTEHAAIVVTEAGRNVVRHGGWGHLFLRRLASGNCRGIEILTVDRGQGFVAPAEVFADGFSTNGGLGMGLGAIVRLSTQSDFYSLPGKGLVVLSRLWTPGLPVDPMMVGALAVPFAEESVCGDSWCSPVSPSGVVLCVADGLGHGLMAAEASQAAVDIVRTRRECPPAEILAAMQAGIGHTRGAVALTVRIDLHAGEMTWAGTGNIDARLVTPLGEQRHLVSQQGSLGTSLQSRRQYRESRLPWVPGNILYMASDGLQGCWHPEDFPGLFSRHPSTISGVLWRELALGTDDATVLVCREQV